jgi:hypothetical protein
MGMSQLSVILTTTGRKVHALLLARGRKGVEMKAIWLLSSSCKPYHSVLDRLTHHRCHGKYCSKSHPHKPTPAGGARPASTSPELVIGTTLAWLLQARVWAALTLT